MTQAERPYECHHGVTVLPQLEVLCFTLSLERKLKLGKHVVHLYLCFTGGVVWVSLSLPGEPPLYGETMLHASLHYETCSKILFY